MTCDGEYFEGCCVCFRLLELHSPDGQHTVVLRCKDGASAHSWFTAIHTNVAALLQQTMDQINSFLSNPSANTHCTLKHIGWLAEQVSHSHTHTHKHFGFYGLQGLSIGVIVFILYKLYVLLP